MLYRSNDSKEYISKERFRIICHLSKASALKLIKSGLIPAIDTGIPTARYLIALEDVIKYLQDREATPEKYGYRKYQRPKRTICDIYKEYDPLIGIYMRKLVEIALAGKPELLTAKDIVEVLGYSRYSIHRWKVKYSLKHIIIKNKVYFSKQCLLDFVGGPGFHSLLYKTDQHIDFLRRAHHAET